MLRDFGKKRLLLPLTYQVMSVIASLKLYKEQQNYPSLTCESADQVHKSDWDNFSVFVEF